MDALSVNPPSPAFLNAVSAPPSLSIGASASSNPLTAQDLAQSLFRQSLQAAAGFPVAEPASGLLRLAPEATASLLASFNAPQAQPTQASTGTSSTAPPANPISPVPSGTQLNPDALAASSAVEAALEAALRFGSGVLGSGAAAPLAPDLSTGLVRDAASVIRAGNVHSQAGGPGPGAFQRSPADLHRILQEYQTSSLASQPQPAGLDLMA